MPFSLSSFHSILHGCSRTQWSSQLSSDQQRSSPLYVTLHSSSEVISESSKCHIPYIHPWFHFPFFRSVLHRCSQWLSQLSSEQQPWSPLYVTSHSSSEVISDSSKSHIPHSHRSFRFPFFPFRNHANHIVSDLESRFSPLAVKVASLLGLVPSVLCAEGSHTNIQEAVEM